MSAELQLYSPIRVSVSVTHLNVGAQNLISLKINLVYFNKDAVRPDLHTMLSFYASYTNDTELKTIDPVSEIRYSMKCNIPIGNIAV
jgi:hypothetical protein